MAGLCSASREEGPTLSVDKEAGSAGLWDCFHPFCPPVSVSSCGAEVTAGVVQPPKRDGLQSTVAFEGIGS